MPRVHFVEKARKDNPVCKKGESYFWWKNRNGPKKYSLKRPRPSQTTTSGHLANIYAAQEAVEDVGIDPTVGNLAASIETAKDAIEAAASTFREEAEEYNQSAENIREYFQYSEKADEIEEKAMACDEAADLCENIVDTLQDCLDRLEELSDPPTRADAEADIGEVEGDEDDYIAAVDEAYDEALSEWDNEHNSIASEAEDAYGEFEGPQF